MVEMVTANWPALSLFRSGETVTEPSLAVLRLSPHRGVP
jgi:hypothetical protein